MIKFTTELKVSEIPNRPMWWVLDEDLVCVYLDRVFVVPKGFETDFASVPRVLWAVVPPYGEHTKAAVLHDYLYSGGYKLERLECDNIFKQAMIASGVSEIKANTMYTGVRSFGWMFFYK